MNKIVSLRSENVKRIQVVEITPDGNVIVIGGRNGQGKSSVLDSIEYAFGGTPSAKMPVRRGEEKARIVVDLGDMRVKRTFTAAGGTSLIVENADGVPQKSPQGLLDALCGKLTFDPLAFAREKPAEQAQTLRAIVGIDTTKYDAERNEKYNERTGINREAKILEGRIAAHVRHENVPEVETPTAEIVAKQQAASERNSTNLHFREYAKEAQRILINAENELRTTISEIERLEKVKGDQETHVTELRGAFAGTKAKLDSLKDVDLAPFKEEAKTVEETNRKVRENKTRAELVTQFKAKLDAAAKLTDTIDAIDAHKRKQITDAKFPIEGLSFDATGGVALNGIPFDQCSSAEQLRVSVAIGLALNPKLRILLIRDGSLLDEQSLAVIADMAAKADAQVWLERVGVDAATSVVIEDGNVQPELEPSK